MSYSNSNGTGSRRSGMHVSSTSNKPKTLTILDFLPPPSAKKYIKPMSGIALHPIPSPSSSSSSSSFSSSCFSQVSSPSSPPSDHGGVVEDSKDPLQVNRATREYHAAVASWTAKTWQAVRFVIEQRSRHPAYANSSPRARSKSPHYPIQNNTSIAALTRASVSESSSYTSTPSSGCSSSASLSRHENTRSSSRILSLHAANPHSNQTSSPSSSSSPSPNCKQPPTMSNLSALFASHNAISDASGGKVSH